MLLEKDEFEGCRTDAEEVGREDETEEENEFSRTTAAIVVPFRPNCLEAGGTGAGLNVSPPFSARVFRLSVLAGGGIVDILALLADALISPSLSGERIRVGGRSWETN